ncbi:class I SAM-dependent methyltransferase [Mycobacterium sp. C31M]
MAQTYLFDHAEDIEYRDFAELWQAYDDSVADLARREGVHAVAELGGGANPVVGDAQRWGFADHRVVVDISPLELSKAAVAVQTRVADLRRPITDEEGSYGQQVDPGARSAAHPGQGAAGPARPAQPAEVSGLLPRDHRTDAGAPSTSSRISASGVEQWRSSFGHAYYSVIPPLQALENAKSRFLRRHPVPALASFSVVLRKMT